MQPYEELARRLGPGRVERDVPLAPFTTFRIGGPADLLYRTRSADELAAAVLASLELVFPAIVLGFCANIIIGDMGLLGIVSRITSWGRALLVVNRVSASSSTLVHDNLINTTVSSGLCGLHHFVGIPSTVGGAIWQNLHFLSPPPERERTVFIEEVFESCELLTAEGERRVVGRDY